MKKFALQIAPYIFPLIYIFLAIIDLSHPGIHYDEIFFGNAALGGIADNTFINLRLGGIPILTLNYIGALKSWLYFPIFKIFGASAYSIRLPMIFISALSLYILYKFTKSFFNKRIALLTLLFMAFDPIYIAMTRVDFGPVALSFFFRVMILYGFAQYLKSKKLKFLILTGFLSVLGWFNKMDFIWFILGFGFSICIIYWHQIYSALKKQSRITAYAGVFSLILFSTIVGYVSIRFKFIDSIDFFYLKHLVNIVTNTISLINGTYFYQTIYGIIQSPASVFYSVITITIIGWQSIYQIFTKKTDGRFFVLLLTTIFIYFQIIITSKAGGPWHLIYIYPFFQIILSYSIDALSHIKYFKVAWFILPIIIMIYLIYINIMHMTSYSKTPKNIHWSNAIYELISFAKGSNLRFVSVDWGTHNQLLVFDYKYGKYFDAWPIMAPDPMEKKDYEYLKSNFLNRNDVIYILHPENYTEFPSTRKNFFKIAKDNNLVPHQIKKIRDSGIVIYELYLLARQ